LSDAEAAEKMPVQPEALQCLFSIKLCGYLSNLGYRKSKAKSSMQREMKKAVSREMSAS
jgi:hypothetical protein